jgi:hypothetical protein
MRGCVIALPIRNRVVLLAMDTAGSWVPVRHNRVPGLNPEVYSALLCAEVDGELGWHMPRQSGNRHMCAQSGCVAGRFKPRRPSSYCPFSCQLYFRLCQWEFPLLLTLVLEPLC